MGDKRSGQDKLWCSHALRVDSPVLPPRGSSLVYCPGDVCIHGKGWGQLSQVWGSCSLRGWMKSPPEESTRGRVSYVRASEMWDQIIRPLDSNMNISWSAQYKQKNTMWLSFFFSWYDKILWKKQCKGNSDYWVNYSVIVRKAKR